MWLTWATQDGPPAMAVSAFKTLVSSQGWQNLYHSKGYTAGLPWCSDSKESAAVREMWVLSLSQEDALEKEMATHSSTLARRIPWTESLVGCSPWGRKESDRTERLNNSNIVDAHTQSFVYVISIFS